MNKAIRQSTPLVLRLAGFMAKVRAKVRFEIPVGFQDEKGFHYGVNRGKDEAKWPPFD